MTGYYRILEAEFGWNIFILSKLFISLKSQKRPNHTNTWSHQTARKEVRSYTGWVLSPHRWIPSKQHEEIHDTFENTYAILFFQHNSYILVLQRPFNKSAEDPNALVLLHPSGLFIEDGPHGTLSDQFHSLAATFSSHRNSQWRRLVKGPHGLAHPHHHKSLLFLRNAIRMPSDGVFWGKELGPLTRYPDTCSQKRLPFNFLIPHPQKGLVSFSEPVHLLMKTFDLQKRSHPISQYQGVWTRSERLHWVLQCHRPWSGLLCFIGTDLCCGLSKCRSRASLRIQSWESEHAKASVCKQIAQNIILNVPPATPPPWQQQSTWLLWPNVYS